MPVPAGTGVSAGDHTWELATTTLAPHRPPGAAGGEDSSSTWLFTGLGGVLPELLPALQQEVVPMDSRSGHAVTWTEKLGTPKSTALFTGYSDECSLSF